MFTGIIEEIGVVREIDFHAKEARIAISCSRIYVDLKAGDSVCVNGVCLTVTGCGERSFTADISEESLQRSTLGRIRRGSLVNLERALTLTSRLGGHIVQGHVDGVGKVKSVNSSGGGFIFSFSCPEGLLPYLVEKGSVAVDGISLTVSDLGNQGFSVAAVPFTVDNTNLKSLGIGDEVNLEVDIISKYVRSYMDRVVNSPKGPDDKEESFYQKLIEGGYV
jgi:riboflavin synthase